MELPHNSDLSDEQFSALRFELVSRLADDIAHEIKNPLNAIVINLEVLKVRVARQDTDAVLERVRVIELETRRLHGLVDRLLQLLRPDRDDATSFALDQVFDELLPLVEARARMARNGFRHDCASTVFVPARRGALKFALLDVMAAVHERLGEGGGTLTLDCEPGPRDVRITIGAQPGDSPLRPADPLFETAIERAAIQLRACGGSLERAGTAVTVLLPLAAPH